MPTRIPPVIHLVTFVLGCLTGSFVGSFPGTCLTVAQLVSFCFGSLRSCVGPETARRLRWYEDTLVVGLITIAVAHLERSIHVDWIIFLVSVVVARRVLTVDPSNTPLVVWYLLRIGEIVFLGFASRRRPTYWTYFAFAVLGSQRRHMSIAVFYVRYFSIAGVGWTYLTLGTAASLALALVDAGQRENGRSKKNRWPRMEW